MKMKKIQTRQDYIRSEIMAWTIRNNLTLTYIAENLGCSQPAVSNFLQGRNENLKIKHFFIREMGINVWEKFPEQQYSPPELKEA